MRALKPLFASKGSIATNDAVAWELRLVFSISISDHKVDASRRWPSTWLS